MIAEGVEEEKGVVDEVALEEALGFHSETEEPFEAELLNKGGGLADFAGVEGEGGSDAEVDGGGKLIEVLGDPEFLFGATKADPDAVGTGIADEVYDFFELSLGPFAEGWRVGSGDVSI